MLSHEKTSILHHFAVIFTTKILITEKLSLNKQTSLHFVYTLAFISRIILSSNKYLLKVHIEIKVI